MSQTIAVGLSGGIDSTLTALLLLEQGYRVIGLTMSIYNKDIPNLKPADNSCYGPVEKADIQVARNLGKEYGFDVHVLDCSEEYKQLVLFYFKQSYLSGITPNPCVKCNEIMKFGMLRDKARQMGIPFDYFATGHYARIQKKDNFILQKGVDLKKDQSYFLYRLPQKTLSETLFPLGNYTKEQVRMMARERGLAVSEKADSQDFYSGDYADLLEEKPRIGNIVHVSGRILGTHQGFWNYTIGQRKGLGISFPVPLFVVDIDAQNNQVIVGEAETTYVSEVFLTDIVCHDMSVLSHQKSVLAKYRSSGKDVPATLKYQQETNKLHIIFDEPQRAVTPGQSLVCYSSEDCISVLCGGIIQNVVKK